MFSDQKQEPGGTLIRGANGSLYFIPDEKLEAFMLPEEKAYEAIKLFGLQEKQQLFGTVKGSPVAKQIGLRAADTTTVSVVNIAALRQ